MKNSNTRGAGKRSGTATGKFGGSNEEDATHLENRLDTRDQEKSELLLWPYMIHALEDSLDAELIEGRGQQLLFQALNQKTAVAFVGSGLPMAFGRLSWIDLQNQQFRLVKTGATAFVECATASENLIQATIDLVTALGNYSGVGKQKAKKLNFGAGKPKFGLLHTESDLLKRFLTIKKNEVTFHHKEVKKLFKTFKTLQSDGQFIGGEGPPIVLQVAEKLQEVLARSVGMFLKPHTDSKDGQSEDDDGNSRQPEQLARFGFIENSEVSPAPQALLDKISAVPAQLQMSDNITTGASIPAGIKGPIERFAEKFCTYRSALVRYHRTMRPNEARLPLPTIAKMLLVDECAHAEQILRNSVDYSTASGRDLWKSSEFSKAQRERREKLNTELRGMGAATSTTNLRRDVHGIRDKPDRYRSLAYFKTEAFQRLINVLKFNNRNDKFLSPAWNRVLDLLSTQLQDNDDNRQGPRREVTRIFVSPTHRFVFQMLTAFFKDPYQELGLEIVSNATPRKVAAMSKTDPTPAGRSKKTKTGITLRNGPDELGFIPEQVFTTAVRSGKELADGTGADWVVGSDLEYRPHIPTKVLATDFKSRQSIMDAELDPVEIIAMRLGISRFLTTNYDLEIERFYQDRGYRRFTAQDGGEQENATSDVRHRGPDVYRVDGIGGMLRDQTFQRKNAANLVGFALDEASADAHVFHLHGRATDTSTIVATERDYMDLYLLQDIYRETVDESIRIGFAANPLIFLGLGMNEADVLRPLRQFMSDQDRAVSRTAIVLLPGVKSRDDQAKEAATIYLRYGAHTIHYGWAEVDVEKTNTGVDWLYHADRLVNTLKSTNKQMRDTLVAALKLASGDGHLSPVECRIKERCSAAYINEQSLDIFVKPQDRLQRLVRTLGKIKAEWKSSGEEDEATGDDDVLPLLLGKKGPLQELGRSRLAVPRFQSRLKFREGHHPGVSDTTAAGPQPLEFECGLLGQLLLLTIRNKLSTDDRKVRSILEGDRTIKGTILEQNLRKDIRELNARIVALEGLPNAIITGALCASLSSLEQQWQNWWRDWQLSPPHRNAQFEALQKRYQKGKVYLPRRYARHRLANVITNLSAHEWEEQKAGESPKYRAAREARNSDRLTDLNASIWEEGKPRTITGVRSFDNFLDAVEARRNFDQGDHWDTGRRWHCVAAPRGTGRGAFLSAFQTARGLGQYIASSWPKNQGPFDPLYVSAIFVNLSFSTEIASTFDMLSEALLDTVATLEALKEAATDKQDHRIADVEALVKTLGEGIGNMRNDIAEDLKFLSRLRRLERLFEKFRVLATEVAGIRGGDWPIIHPRLLLSISGVDMLHYAGGLPKNREIEEFLALLTKAEMQNTPYDLVLVTNEDNLGEIFVEETAFLRRYHSTIAEYEPDLLPVADTNDRSQREASNEFIPINRLAFKDDEDAVQTVRRRMDRSGIYFKQLQDLEDRTSSGPIPDAQQIRLPEHRFARHACYVHFARVVKPIDLLIDNFLPLAAILYIHYQIKNPNRKSPKLSSEISADFVSLFRIPSKNLMGAASGGEVSSIEQAWSNSSPDSCLDEHEKLKKRRLERVRTVLCERTGKSDNEEIADLLRTKFDKHDLDHARLSREWRNIRTVLNNNRYCLTILLAAAQRHALSGRDITDGARRAEAFIRKAVDHVRAVSSSRREESVLHDVLDAYEAFNVIGEPHNDYELHLILLRHLAVIGSPCSADILVRTPQILEYFDKLPEDRERSRNLRVIQALTVLAERGLIFRLEPHPQLTELHDRLSAEPRHILTYHFERGEAPRHHYRYGLHRLMQRHILQKMGSGPREFAEINSLAPSLYASMPSDLPRLNQETYRFLRELVDSLSQYPDRGGQDPAGQRWHFGEAPHTTRVQALRCALSLVHSTFSVAVVSRFESLYAEKGNPPRGYFEAYRVQVRWLIRKAWEIFDKGKEFDPLDYRPEDAAERQLAAFYRDEIIWLYNECGVVCLVQGNLRDAASLLRQAIHFNRHIEGFRDGGPQYNRLSLNLAITQIESGKLDGAYNRLQAICKSELRYGSRPGRIWHIAHGYLGLIQHLRGDLEDAKKRYQRAIKVLRVYDDLRACSIFSKHLGDLERMRGRLDDAEEHINSAVSFAQAGGHEDLHKRSRLSQIMLDIANRTKADFSIRSTLAQLRLIEDYAETMEMPSLLSDVLTVRARLLLEQGESTLAGSLLSRAMVMAKRNGMNLRLNSAMTNYARVLAMRGLPEQANQLLFKCLDMAKRNNNQIEISRAEEAFDALHQISRLQDRQYT